MKPFAIISYRESFSFDISLSRVVYEKLYEFKQDPKTKKIKIMSGKIIDAKIAKSLINNHNLKLTHKTKDGCIWEFENNPLKGKYKQENY